MLFQKEQNTNRVVIKGYKDGTIHISGERYTQPVLIDSQNIQAFQARDFASLETDLLLKQIPTGTEIVLIGTGSRHQMLSVQIVQQFNRNNLALEVMATRPACHTFQVLVHENRKVVALLFP